LERALSLISYLFISGVASLRPWGDASKAREELSWSPNTSLDGLLRRMVEADSALARQQRCVFAAGLAAT
jgi:nucleoside-diphosphate-sugar epimerase